MAQSDLPIRILAEPKAEHRERYVSEMMRSRNRSRRYIRADTNENRLDYPTIEILSKWSGRRLYIRITLTTVPTHQAPVVCVHPYPIDSPDSNIIRDTDRNTLYFPVSEDDFRRGQKSFRIIRKKLIQHELRNYGQLRLLNEDVRDIPRTNDPTDARQLIDAYQLGSSRLVFSIAEFINDNMLPVIYSTTSVYSNIMTATTTTTNDDNSFVRCAPQKGDWHGGDDILMVVPKLDRRKSCEIYFEYIFPERRQLIEFEYVDSKTVAFTTPACPMQANGNQTIEIPITINQNGEEIGRFNFVYQSCSKCSQCDRNSLFDSFDEPNTYEQSSTLDMYFDENDHFMPDGSDF